TAAPPPATGDTPGADGDPTPLTYVWKVNGTTVATHATPSSTDTLDLSQVGNGDKGDDVSVMVTPNDGTVDGSTVSTSATVVDSAPVVDSVAISPASPKTNDLLSANVASHDADGDTVAYSYQWKKNGAAIPGATGSTLDLSAA